MEKNIYSYSVSAIRGIEVLDNDDMVVTGYKEGEDEDFYLFQMVLKVLLQKFQLMEM